MKRRIQKKNLKKRESLLAAVVIILDEIDPMGLLYIASEADFSLEEEYMPEARELVANLNDKMGLRDIEKELKRIFDKWFYFPDIPREVYIAAARKIMNSWFAFQGKPEIEYTDEIKLPQHKEPIIVEVD